MTLYLCDINIAKPGELGVCANTWWQKKTSFKSSKQLNTDLDFSRNKCDSLMERSETVTCNFF